MNCQWSFRVLPDYMCVVQQIAESLVTGNLNIEGHAEVGKITGFIRGKSIVVFYSSEHPPAWKVDLLGHFLLWSLNGNLHSVQSVYMSFSNTARLGGCLVQDNSSNAVGTPYRWSSHSPTTYSCVTDCTGAQYEVHVIGMYHWNSIRSHVALFWRPYNYN